MIKFDWIAALFNPSRMKNRHKRGKAVSLRAVERLEDRSLLTAVSWISATDGLWNVATNWSTGQVPGPTDDVTINPAGTLTITISSGAQSVKSLTSTGDDILQLTAGSLAIAETSTVSNLSMSGGLLAANQQLLLTGSSTFANNSSTLSGLIRNEGTFNITSGDPNFNAVTFDNAATIINSGASLDFEGNATLNNLSGGLFDVTFGGNIAFVRQVAGSNNLFHNTGTLRRSSAGDASISNLPFQNDASGVIDVTAGSLTLNGSGSMAGGTFNVALNSALNFSGSNFTLTGNYTGSGAGHVEFSNGTLTPNNATFNFPGGFFNWSSNSANISNGTLNNTGFLQITGGDPNLNQATLNNTGTIVNSGASLDFEGESTLNNLAGALFDVTFNGNGAFVRQVAGSNNLFHNTGTLRRSGTDDASLSNLPFQNDASGVIDVTAGSLTLNGSGSMAGGTFTVAPGSALRLSQSNFTLTGNYTGSGGGQVEFSNGTLTPNGATFNFPAGFFNWSSNSATISNGTLNNTGFLQITSGDPNLNTATLNNSGTITNSGANLDFEGNATLNNLSGALFDITFGGNTAFVRQVAGSNNLFHNTGTLRRSVNTGDASLGNLPFQNDASGVIDVTTGSLTLNGSGSMAGGTFNVALNSALNFSGSNFTLTGNYTGSGLGHIEFSSGTLTPNGATFNFPAGFFNWSSNSATISNGTLSNTGFLQITSGDPNLGSATLNNSGTIINSGASLDFVGDATLNNLSGALFETTLNGNNAFLRNVAGSNNLFHNTGTLRRSGTGDASISNLPYQNDASGVIDITAGSLTLNGSGSMAGGTFTVASGSALNFSGSNFTLTGNYTGSGDGHVEFSNGTLTPNNATFNFPAGFFNWSSNSASIANGTLNNIGAIQITGGDPNLNTATLNNAGTIVNSGASLDFEGNATLNNLEGALFNVTFGGNSAFVRQVAGSNNLFHNTGTLRRSVNTGDASISNLPFQNDASGVIDVTAGSVTLNGSGSMAGGTFTVAMNSALNFSGSNFTLTGSYTGSGAGHIEFSSGTLTPNGATFNFPAGYFNWSSNSANIANGILNNTGFVQITGGDPNLNQATLNNAGTIVNSGAALDFEGEATLNNLAGALFDITFNGNGAFVRQVSGGNNLFHNTGTLRRSGTLDASISNLPFQNDAGGVIDVTAGSLTLNGSGSMAGGTFDVALNSALNFSGSNFTLTGSYTGSGSGHIEFSNGSLTPNNATFNFPEGFFNWSSNSASIVNGTLNNAGFIQLTGGDPNLNNAILNNAGTLINAGANLDFEGNAILNNLEGGLFDITFGGNSAFVRQVAGSNNLFQNLGTLRRSNTGDASFSNLPFSNPGTVEVDAGSLTVNTSVAQVVGSTLTGGTWEVQDGTNINLTGTTILTNNGTLIFHGTGTITGITGALTTNDGSLELFDGSGFGTTGAFTNNGELVIGPDSVFATATTFTQSASGRVEFQLGGTPASGDFGRLISTGVANLDGTAAFSFVDGYGPLTGQQFVVATFPSHVGDFAEYDQPLAGQQNTLDPLLQSTQLVVNAVIDAADLAVSNVSGAPTAVSGQNVTVNWTVTNTSDSATSTSAWTDSVYLSVDGTYDPTDKLIGRVPHAGSLAPSAFYNGTLTLPLPGVLPGNYRFVVVTDSQGQMPDRDRSNNATSSVGTIATDVTSLTPGVPFSGTIANGQDLYFRVTLPALATRDVSLLTGVAGAAELLVRQGNIPASDANDGFVFDPTSTTGELLVTGGVAGEFFIALHGRSNAGAGTSFTVTADGLNFSVLSLDQTQARNAGDVTITVHGSQFTHTTTFELQGPGNTTINASRVLISEAGTAFVTFPLGGAAAGSYSITGHQGAAASTLNNALTITVGGTAGTLAFDIISPRYIRPNGRPGVVQIEFANTGDADLPAQLLLLSATDTAGAQTIFSLPGSQLRQRDGIQLLTINPDGPAGVLPPGAHGTLMVNFEPTSFAPHALTQFSLSHPDADEPLLWNSLKTALQPAFINNAAWDIVFANFVNNVGTTVGAFATRLSADANYLSTVTQTTPTFDQLLNFELVQADDYGSISTRLRPGAFGTGFADPNDYQARTDADGNVSIGQQGSIRFFEKLATGAYRGSPGETGVLTLSSGIYTLTERDGTRTVFRNDGKVNFVGTPDDDRLTYGYNGAGQIASLTVSSSGAVTSFTYDGTGHVTAVNGPSGEQSTFTYDAAGRRTSDTTRNGTMLFTYVTTPGSAAFGAISSLTYSDGEVVTYAYDAAGRLSHTQNAAGFLDLAYPGPGQKRVSDTHGSVTTIFFDDSGTAVRQIDASGETVSAERNGANQLVQIVAEDGAAYSFQYDVAGNVTRMTMADGSSVLISYTGPLHRVASFTNGLGATTRYEYDSFGRPTRTTFADGSTDVVTYDSHGRPLTEMTRGGNVIVATYDAEGKLTGMNYPDIPDQAYTYDANGNIASVTDASGTANFTYDAGRRLTHVDYPGGGFINYTYNSAGQRTQMVDSSGFTTRYIYGANGQVSEIRDGANQLLTQYTYDASGRLTREDFANGTATTYGYDARHQVTSVTHLAPGGATQSFTNYTYDAAGRRLTMVNGDGTTTYGYDIRGRLSAVDLPGDRTILYQYDAHGNRVTVNDDSVITNYAVNSIDEYTSAGANTFTYDPDGNIATMTEGGVTTTFTYDSAGRVQSSLNPTRSISYQYNALGQLAAVTDNGVTRRFLYDPTVSGRMLAEFDGQGNLVRRYLQGVSGVVAQIAPNGDFFGYGFDGNSNVTQLTDDSGAVVNTYSYLPYGEVLSQSETVANPYKFVGKHGVLDFGDGMNYAGVRLYDSNLGRFLSPDSVRGIGVNPYTYANNQPTNQIDFSGYDPVQDSYSGFSSASTNVTAATSATGLLLQGSQKAIDAAHTAKVDQLLSAGGGFLQETESMVLAGASNQAAVANSRFNAVSDKLGVVTTAIDANVFLNSLNNYAAGDHSLSSTLALIHDAGVLGNDALGQSPNPVLKGVSATISILDWATQAPLTSFYDNYYAPDPNDVFGPRGEDLLDNPGPTDHNQTEQITPNDPNDIIGPNGPGADVIPDGSTPPTRFEGFITGEATSSYQINFENQASATAPAQVVVITLQLDGDLDWTTFELGDFSFGMFEIQVPTGRSSYHTVVDVSATLGVVVDFNAELNFSTGLVTWTLASQDPVTGDLPLDPLAGFLPPNTTPPNGDGFVKYSIHPEESLANGTEISAQATIVFDLEDPIDTPLVHNTIDNVAPTSSVTALPGTENTTSFTVNWSGTDPSGSGIATFDVFVSDNGGPFMPFVAGTPNTSAIFTGQQGHTYGFYSVATDGVGNEQATPAGAQTTTTVSMLIVGGPAVTWTKKDPPVTVLPQITVGGDSLGGGTLTINVNAVGTAKKLLDQFSIPGFAGIGTSAGPQFANGQLTLQIQLNQNVTASAIQSFLRGITFSTKGKGLKTLTRTMSVTLANSVSLSSNVSQTINVRKKA